MNIFFPCLSTGPRGPETGARRLQRKVSRWLGIAALTALATIGQDQSARGTTIYWEPTGTTGTTASGTWDTISVLWNTDPTVSNTTLTIFAAGEDAVFSDDPFLSASGTSTIKTSNLSANSITFGNSNLGGPSGGAAGGFTFTHDGTITLGGTAGNTALTLNAGVGNVLFQGTVAPANTAGVFAIKDNSANSLTFTNGFTNVNNGTTLAITGTGTGAITFNGGFQGNSNNSGNNGTTFNLNLGGSGPVNLNASGPGAGIATVGSSSTLNINTALALQGYDLNLNSGGTVNFGSSVTAASLAGLSGSGTLVLTNTASTPGAVTLTLQGVGNSTAGLNGGASNPTFSGNITGLGGLTITSVSNGAQANGGTATFSGNLTFSGSLNVTNSGSGYEGGASTGNATVVLSGTDLIGGNVTVSGGTLMVTGSLGSAGTISTTTGAGSNIGTLQVGALGTVGAVTVSSGTFTNSGNAGALTISSGASATLNGGSITGSITANGNLTFGNTTNTAFTIGNISGAGQTGNITYNNLLAAGNTLNFAAGANSFNGLTASAGTLYLTGTGSNNTFKTSFMGNGAAATTVFQSGTYSFAGSSNSGTNQIGTINVTGATVNFSGGQAFASAGNSTIDVSGGTLEVASGQFDPGDTQAVGTTITFNLSGAGLLDFYGINSLALGGANNGTSANVTQVIDQTGGTFQDGVTGQGGSLSIGGKGGVAGQVSTYDLSGGTLISSQTISGAAAQVAGNNTNNFDWTGGILTALGINTTNLTSNDGISAASIGTLTNGGGALAPGFIAATGNGQGGAALAGTQYTGLTTITGNYKVDSGNAALDINLGGTTAANGFLGAKSLFDNVSVTGTAVVGGLLNVRFINSFTPAAANTFTILQTGKAQNSLAGLFTNTQTGKAATPNRILVDSSGLNSMSVTYTAGSASVNGSIVVGNYVAGNTYTAVTGSAWDAAAAGSWSVFDPGSSGLVASGAMAQFGDGAGSGTGANNVTLNSTRDIQGIQFSSAIAGHNYTIATSSTGAIILDNMGNSAAATIADSSASGNADSINVPMILDSNLTASVANAATTLSIGGALGQGSAGISLTKNGAGTLVLGSSDSFTGSTKVQQGTLIVSGSISGTQAVNVSAAASLEVDGAINNSATATVNGAISGAGSLGAINVSGSGSRLAPGLDSGVNAAGTLTANGSVSLTGSTTFSIRLGVVTANDHDQLTLGNSGTVSLGGAALQLTIGSVLNNPANVGLAYVIINGGAAATGVGGNAFAQGSTITTPGGFKFNILYASNAAGTGAGNDVVIKMTAIPEPGTWTTVIIGGGMLLLFRRRRRL